MSVVRVGKELAVSRGQCLAQPEFLPATYDYVAFFEKIRFSECDKHVPLRVLDKDGRVSFQAPDVPSWMDYRRPGGISLRYNLVRDNILGAGAFGIVVAYERAWNAHAKNAAPLRFCVKSTADRYEFEGWKLLRDKPQLAKYFTRAVSQAAHHQKSWYVFMPMFDGNLRALSRQGVITPSSAANLAAQLAEALAAVRAAGLVYTDIKPANCLYYACDDRSPAKVVVRLGDLGSLRRERSAPIFTFPSPEVSWLAVSQMITDPAEQEAGMRWALGVTILIMLIGDVPEFYHSSMDWFAQVKKESSAEMRARLFQSIAEREGGDEAGPAMRARVVNLICATCLGNATGPPAGLGFERIRATMKAVEASIDDTEPPAEPPVPAPPTRIVKRWLQRAKELWNSHAMPDIYEQQRSASPAPRGSILRQQ